MNAWKVRTISGCAIDGKAEALLSINADAQTVEEVRQMVEAVPFMLAALENVWKSMNDTDFDDYFGVVNMENAVEDAITKAGRKP